MTRRAGPRGRGGGSGGAGGGGERKINLNASPTKRATFTPAKPLKPRRKLFAGLMVAMGAWVALLLTLYFTTVYPRHAPDDIRPPEATQSS